VTESNALASGEVEKILDVPPIDMTGNGNEATADTAQNEAPSPKGRPKGSKNKPKGEAQLPTPRRRRSRSGGNDAIETALVDLVANVNALAREMKSQGREVKDLRKRLDSVRKLLG
jgi:hypothetical protein